MGILKSIRNRIPESRRAFSSKKSKDYCAMSLDSGETDAIFSQESASDDDFFSHLVERESPTTESVVASPEIVSPLKSPIKEDEVFEEELFPILSSKDNDWEEAVDDKRGTSVSTLTAELPFPVVPKNTKSLADDIESSAEASESSTAIQKDLVALEQPKKVPKVTISIVSPEETIAVVYPEETVQKESPVVEEPVQKESPAVEGTTTPTTTSPPKAIESPHEDLATFTPTISNKTTIANVNVVPEEIKNSLQHKLAIKDTNERTLVRNLIQDFESGTAGTNSLSTATRPTCNKANISVITFGRKKGSLVHMILFYVPDFKSNSKVENVFDAVKLPDCTMPQSVVDTSNQIRDEFKEFCVDHAAMLESACSDVPKRREEFKEFCKDRAAMVASVCNDAPKSSSGNGDDQQFEMLVFNKADRINRVLCRLKDLDDNKKGEFTMHDGTKIPHFFVEENDDIAFIPAVVDDDEETVFSSHTASFKSMKGEEKKPEESKTVTPVDYFQETVNGIKKEFKEFCDDHATMVQVNKGVSEFCDEQSVVFSVATSRAEAQATITYDTLKGSLFEVMEALERFSEAFRCGIASAVTDSENQVAAIWDTIEYWENDNKSTMRRELDEETTYTCKTGQTYEYAEA